MFHNKKNLFQNKFDWIYICGPVCGPVLAQNLKSGGVLTVTSREMHRESEPRSRPTELDAAHVDASTTGNAVHGLLRPICEFSGLLLRQTLTVDTAADGRRAHGHVPSTRPLCFQRSRRITWNVLFIWNHKLVAPYPSATPPCRSPFQGCIACSFYNRTKLHRWFHLLFCIA